MTGSTTSIDEKLRIIRSPLSVEARRKLEAAYDDDANKAPKSPSPSNIGVAWELYRRSR